MSWNGKKVRHTDGRSGKLRESAGFLHLSLEIRCDDGSRAYVQLNANGPDTGEPGWQWLCENFLDGPAWLPLGDHSGCEVEYVDPTHDRRARAQAA